MAGAGGVGGVGATVTALDEAILSASPLALAALSASPLALAASLCVVQNILVVASFQCKPLTKTYLSLVKLASAAAMAAAFLAS